MTTPDPLAGLARDWLRGVTSAGFVPGVRARARTALRDLLEEFVAAVRAEPFDPAPGHRIGTELVDLRMSAPPVIGTTIHLLAGRLPAILGPDAHPRVLALLEQLATGFVAAQRDAALRAAEEMNRAEKIHWRTVQSDLQRRLQHALLHHPDTGLPNEQYLRKHLAELTAERAGICLVSVDACADLTDVLGHDATTRLLVSVAERLGGLGGHFLAHLGDDQFALVAAGTTGPDDLVKLGDRARRALAAPSLRLTVTIGGAERPTAGAEPDRWLHDARLALRWARQDGRGTAVFEPGRAAADRRRHELAAAMPEALDRGEFVLHYQPLLRLADRTVIGFEALARWQRPGAGTLHPQHFITLAERTGLIRPLGRHLLELACRQGAAWRRAGHDLLISVNLSPRQLGEPDLAADVADVLHRTGLPADRLQLEVTENFSVIEHRAVLQRLTGLGLRLALDDFGTGWATLGALAKLPFTDVKLAADLLAGPPEVLRHAIGAGQALGKTVTAEGIETPAQAELLRELGCEQGQGYHLGRPAPPAQCF